MSVIASRLTDSLEPVTVTMPAALNAAWKAIRRRHPGVPLASVQVAPGRGSGCQAVAWGSDSPVILVAAETVQDGPRAVLDALLHQAAHGLTSKANAPRYHNTTYRDAAQSLNLAVTFTRHGIGWSQTSLRDDAAERDYAGALGQLAQASADWEPPGRPGGWTADRNGVLASCQCYPPRTIRVRGRDAAADLLARPVICSQCGKPFMP